MSAKANPNSGVLVMGVLSAWLAGRLGGRVVQWALIPVILFDLLPLAAAHIDLVDPHSLFLQSTPALDYVSAQTGTFRVYSSAGDLPYAVAATRKVETLEGLLAFQVGHAVKAIREATGCQTVAYATAVPACLTDRVRTSVVDAAKLGRLNVRYVISHEPLPEASFKRVLVAEPAVYENLLWQPRVQVAAPNKASLLTHESGHYEIQVEVSQPDQLVVSETWLPGWQAVVDGQPRGVQRVDEALMGVSLNPGDRIVQLAYNPVGWRIGWPLSLVALVGLGVWCGVAWLRRVR